MTTTPIKWKGTDGHYASADGRFRIQRQKVKLTRTRSVFVWKLYVTASTGNAMTATTLGDAKRLAEDVARSGMDRGVVTIETDHMDMSHEDAS